MGIQDVERGHEWSIQPGEPPKVYALFLRYAKLPLEKRTLAELAKVSGLSKDRLGALSARFQWVSRADAYETWRLKIRELAHENAEIRRATQEAETVNTLSTAAFILATRYLERIQNVPKTIPVLDRKGEPVMDTTTGLAKVKDNPEWTVSPGTLVELTESSIKLARLIRGEPGSAEEFERQRARDAMLAKLKDMAEKLQSVPEGEGEKP